MSTDQDQDQGQPQGPEQRPHEDWAEAKGFLPRLQKSASGAQRQNPSYGKYSAGVAHRRWAERQLVTEADFDAALDEAANQISR